MAWTRIEGPTWLRKVGCVEGRRRAGYSIAGVSMLLNNTVHSWCFDKAAALRAIVMRGKVVAQVVRSEIA